MRRSILLLSGAALIAAAQPPAPDSPDARPPGPTPAPTPTPSPAPSPTPAPAPNPTPTPSQPVNEPGVNTPDEETVDARGDDLTEGDDEPPQA